jgi:outer membrane protein assembly factor BamB
MGNGTMQFFGPSAIKIGTDGKIYLSDENNSRLVRMDDWTGTGWKTLGTSGSSTKQFSGLKNIALDASGRIYIADSSNNRLLQIIVTAELYEWMI